MWLLNYIILVFRRTCETKPLSLIRQFLTISMSVRNLSKFHRNHPVKHTEVHYIHLSDPLWWKEHPCYKPRPISLRMFVGSDTQPVVLSFYYVINYAYCQFLIRLTIWLTNSASEQVLIMLKLYLEKFKNNMGTNSGTQRYTLFLNLQNYLLTRSLFTHHLFQWFFSIISL